MAKNTEAPQSPTIFTYLRICAQICDSAILCHNHVLPINPVSARTTAMIMINRSMLEENGKMETSFLNELTNIFRRG